MTAATASGTEKPSVSRNNFFPHCRVIIKLRTRATKASRTKKVGRSHVFIHDSPPNSTASPISSQVCLSQNRMLSVSSSWSNLSPAAIPSTPKGSAITCGCRSPRRKLKKGNSVIVSGALGETRRAARHHHQCCVGYHVSVGPTDGESPFMSTHFQNPSEP